VPQIYWSRISTAANFTTLINWWNEEVLYHTQNRPVNLYIGLADYKVGTNNDIAWERYGTELMGQIIDIREKEAAMGQVHFSYRSMINNPLRYFDHIKREQYNYTVLPPAYEWKDETAATPPASVTLSNSGGLKLHIASAADDTAKFVIYRSSSATGSVPVPDKFCNSHIAGVVFKTGDITVFEDKAAVRGYSYRYFVTAVSKTGVESLHMTASDTFSI
jgi:hypothetical protein